MELDRARVEGGGKGAWKKTEWSEAGGQCDVQGSIFGISAHRGPAQVGLAEFGARAMGLHLGYAHRVTKPTQANGRHHFI